MKRPIAFLALDEFGARVLGQLELLLLEPGGAEPLCLLGWYGPGRPPEDSRFWGSDYPNWDWNGSDQEDLDTLLQHEIPERFGRAEVSEVRLILVTNLGTEGIGDKLLSILGSQSEARRHGRLVAATTEFLLLGGGVFTPEAASDPGPVRVRIAEALLGLQQWFESHEGPDHRAGCYVGLEELPGRQYASPAEQLTPLVLLAYAFVLYADQAMVPRAREAGQLRLERGEQSTADDAMVWESEKPFAAVGARCVQLPALRIRRIVAVRLAQVCLETFCAEDSRAVSVPGGLEEALLKLVSPSRHELQIQGPGSSWREPDLAAWIEDVCERNWPRVRQLFGRDRFRAIPIDDWQVAFDELCYHIDTTIIPPVRAAIGRLPERSVELLDRVLERHFDQIGDEACDEADFAPRPRARTAVETVRAWLAAARDAAIERRNKSRTYLDPEELEKVERDLQAHKDAVLAELHWIPSPWSVALRVAFVAILCVSLALGTPLEPAVLESSFWRMMLGLTVAIVIGGIWFYRLSRKLGKVLDRLDQWIDERERLEEYRLERTRHEIPIRCIEAQESYCRWLLGESDVADFLPSPEPFETEELQASRQWSGWDRRRFLRRFREDLDTALDETDKLSSRIRSDLVANRFIRCLPLDLESRETDELFPNVRWARTKPDRDTVRDAVLQLRDEEGWHPFRRVGDGPESPPNRWGVDARIWRDVEESHDGIPDEATDRAVAEPRMPDLLRRAEEYLAQNVSLTLGQALGLFADEYNSKQELHTFLVDESRLPVGNVYSGRRHSVHIVTRGTAPIVEEELGSLTGEAELEAVIRIRSGLSADDLIFGSTKDDPPFALGRAYNASRTRNRGTGTTQHGDADPSNAPGDPASGRSDTDPGDPASGHSAPGGTEGS